MKKLEKTVAERLAAYIVNFDENEAPPVIVDTARSCLLYGLGIAMCGLGTVPARIGRDAAIAMDRNSKGAASILFDGTSGPINAALIANTALFHARAQEDTSGTAHLGAILIPLLIGVAETREMPLDGLLAALMVGYEVGGHLESELAPYSLAHGFRATPLYGLLAATAALCRFLRLDAGTTANALAFAVSFSGANTQAIADGSEEWRFQLGGAAQNALMAVELANAGATGSSNAFEGKFGFSQVFARRDFPEGVLDRLGREWALERVMFKPYPVCAHNQSAVAGAIKIRTRMSLDDVDRIEVHVNPYMVPGMLLGGPFTRSSETLLSVPFCVACAVSRGRVEIGDLEAFSDAQINRLSKLVTVVPNDRINYPASEIVAFAGQREVVRHAEVVTAVDYNYSLAQSKAQLRRMIGDRNILAGALESLEALVDNLSAARVAEISQAFTIARSTAS